jgi:hypothetical protein
MTDRDRTTDITGIEASVSAQLVVIGGVLQQLVDAEVLSPKGDVMEAFAGINTFAAISLRIISLTNASKVRACAKAVELQSYINPSFKKTN